MQELRYIFISDRTHLFSCQRPCSRCLITTLSRIAWGLRWSLIGTQFKLNFWERNGSVSATELSSWLKSTDWSFRIQQIPFSTFSAFFDISFSLRVTITLFISKIKQFLGWLGIDERLICQFWLATVCSDALFAAIKCPNTWIYRHRWVFRVVEQIKFTWFTAKIKDKLYYLEIVNYTTYIVFL